MKKQLEDKLIHIIREIHAMRETYKAEIEGKEGVEVDLDAGTVSLEDALTALQEEPEDESDGEDSVARHQAFESAMRHV